MRHKPVRKLLVACIAGALFIPGQGFTLGLGEIEVNSALNQQLDADIELLSAVPEDAESLIVKLASRQEFSRAGLDRPFLLNDLRFKTVVINDIPHIKVSTKSPVREPFLNFLLEVDWPKGHLLREYTILLDPPVFMTQSSSLPAQTAGAGNEGFRPASNTVQSSVQTPSAAIAPSVSFRPTRNQVAEAPAESRQAQQQFGKSANVAAPVQHNPSEYRIKSGDTAWSLADAMRPDRSVTVEQMMIALLRSNPESFINENINGLKRGYILRVPDAASIASISPSQAQALVREQAGLWREYSRTYAGSQPATVIEGGSTSAETMSAGADQGARLQIVSAGSGASTSGTKDPTDMSASELREALALAREKLETERVEKETLQDEIEQLEHQVSKMKGMLAIEDGTLADAQALAEGQTGEAAAGQTESAAAAEVEVPESLAETSTDETVESAEESLPEDTNTDTSDEAVFVDETQPQDGAVSEENQAEGTAETASATDETMADTAPQAPVDIVSRPPQDPLTRLLNDPMMLAAGGGGLVLLLALLYLVIKRRKESAESGTDTPELVTEDKPTDLEDIADMVEEDQLENAVETASENTEEQPEEVDTESTMILDASDTSEDTTKLDVGDITQVDEEEEPRDDVIAEADVYLAYGIYQQAEELLENAIKEHPDRDDYRLKLAETHYASKNKEAFVEAASALRQSSGDDTAAWKKVFAMGQDLCADDPLFQGSMVGGLDVDALAPKTPEMDFDLGIEESDEDSTEVSSGLDEEPLDLPDMDSDTESTAVLDADESSSATESVLDEELEFDLSETEAIAEPDAAEAQDDEEEFSLDIDASELDIDEDADTESVEAVEEDIEIDLSDDEVIADLEATMQVDANELEIDMDEEEDEQQVSDVEQMETDSAEKNDELDIDFGLDDDEGDTELPTDSEETVIAESEEVEIDLSDEAAALDMDFSETDESLSDVSMDDELPSIEDDLVMDESALDNSDTALSEEEEFDLSSLDDVDEISTKLDLARAYLDMGDHEGTKEILEEVLADGNDAQKQEANELMSQLEA